MSNMATKLSKIVSARPGKNNRRELNQIFPVSAAFVEVKIHDIEQRLKELEEKEDKKLTRENESKCQLKNNSAVDSRNFNT